MDYRKDPNNEIWKDAEFDVLDASTCVLFHPNGNVLVYWQGGPIEKNIIIPSMLAEKIARHQFKLYERKCAR